MVVKSKDLQILHEFLKEKNIDYVLTGTAALFHHGLLPENTEVHDIDIIVLTTDETRSTLQTLFRSLENLSGCTNEDYRDNGTFYTFKVGACNIKVNAFEYNTDKEGHYLPCHTMLIDGCPTLVHDVMPALKAKFKLNRAKDHSFFAKLVSQLANMFPNV